MLARSLKSRSGREEQILKQLWKGDQVARRISLFSGLPYEELRDAAREYIVKIYDSWDDTKGANFSTWVNRCLNYHMMNYLRDHSRLIKIPRSYSDNYLKIKRLKKNNVNITDEQISTELNIPLVKIRAIETAFAIKISNKVEHLDGIETEDLHNEHTKDIPATFENYNALLVKISSLEPTDEAFLTDFLIKKRSMKTLLKKYPELKTEKDIKNYADMLIEYIITDTAHG
jgi:DNA-directed RNA polymerase specialized sigma subunit